MGESGDGSKVNDYKGKIATVQQLGNFDQFISTTESDKSLHFHSFSVVHASDTIFGKLGLALLALPTPSDLNNIHKTPLQTRSASVA